jgi:hypothetical protein
MQGDDTSGSQLKMQRLAPAHMRQSQQNEWGFCPINAVVKE